MKITKVINKKQALELLHSQMQSANLRKHCYSVAAVMRALAIQLNSDIDIGKIEDREFVELWEVTGLVHDLDYEKFPETHPAEGIKILQENNFPKEIVDTVRAHAWGYLEGSPKPQTKMEWGLYCCDELTGLIVACALVRPDKKLASVDVDAVQKKWKQKSFAAGVDRSQIEMCEKELGIPLSEFIQIALRAMQGISKDLGL